jgi:hypothetical protein
MANGRRMKGASHNGVQRPPSTSSWPSTKKARLASGVVKTGPFEMPNQTIRFP